MKTPAEVAPIKRVSFCPHCGNEAPQRLVYSQFFYDEGYALDGTLVADDLPTKFFVAVCETCNQVLLYVAQLDFLEDEDFRQAYLHWPAPGELDAAVPKHVGERYAEAARIKKVAPNAFAVQIRRALEAMCDDRGAKKGPLQHRLADLAARGEIPPVLAEMTKELRLLGNTGAHASAQSIKPGQVDAIDDFFRAVIEYVYVAPSRLKRFQMRSRAE